MIIWTGFLASVGDATPALQINGRVDIWRGPGNGTFVLERRSVGTSTWRSTGDTLAGEGSAALTATAGANTGGMEYRVRCATLPGGAPIELEIAQ